MNQGSRRSICKPMDGSDAHLRHGPCRRYYSRPLRAANRPGRLGQGGPNALKEVILTPEGYEKLKQEIDYLQNEKRREVAECIRVAREFGDIAENAEYDDAKNEQAMLEHRIATLEERLRDARVISKKDIAKDVVSVGSKVKLRDVAAKETNADQLA